MSEPTTPETPSTPTSDEAAALALLDVRGRQAATSLRTAVDRLAAEDPPAGAVVVGVRPAAPRRGHGRTWLLAAAVLAVAGLVAAVTLLVRADDQEGMVTDDAPGYLVPGWLPDGWELQEARDLRTADIPGALTGTVTVYGDPDADDPWTGPTLSVWQTADDGLRLDEGDDVEETTVGGLPATIEDGGSTLLVRILDGDDMVLVMAYQLERSTVLAAAEAAVSGDDAGVRPEGFERLASGPLSAAGTVGGYAVDGLSLLYGGASSDAGQLVVLQRAGDRDDAELLRLMAAEVETTEVRGLPAYATDGFLQWYEPAARAVVTVMGGDVDGSVLEQFADGLRAARPGEVDDLVRAYGGSGPAGRLQPGEVLVAEGEYADGQPWQLVASDDGSEGFGLTFSDAVGGSGTGVERSGGWGTLSIDVVDHRLAGESGRVGVYGAVTPEASEVVIEAPGHEPIRFELHTVDGIAGWNEKVFAGLVPVDLGSAEAVARAADGRELARVSLDAGDDGVPAGDVTTGDDSATSESCVPLPDGGEECTASTSSEDAPGG